MRRNSYSGGHDVWYIRFTRFEEWGERDLDRTRALLLGSQT